MLTQKLLLKKLIGFPNTQIVNYLSFIKFIKSTCEIVRQNKLIITLFINKVL